MSWIATGTVKTEKDLDKLDLRGDKRKKQTKAQYAAASKAAESLLSEFDGPVNVTLSGIHDEEASPDQVQVALVAEER